MKTSIPTFIAELTPPRALGVASVKTFSRRAIRTLPEIGFRGSAAALALFALCGFNPQSLANTYTKNNTAGDLDTTGVWVGGTIPGSGDIALFNNTITGAQADTVTTAPLTIGEIQLTNPGGALTITPGASDALTINGVSGVGIDLSSATQNLTIAGPLTLGGSQIWNVDSGHDIYDTGVTTGGTYGITENGLGTIQFQGSAAGTATTNANDTFTGTITANGGTIYVNDTVTNQYNVLDLNTSLALSGGTFYFTGGANLSNCYQYLNGVSVGVGGSVVNASTRGANDYNYLYLGNVTRSAVGGSVIIYGPSRGGVYSTTTNNANGIIGGWAIWNGTDFAKANGTGTSIGAATYATNAWATNDNTSVAATTESFSGNTGSLLFYLNSSDTVTLAAGTNIISSGGILVTTAVNSAADSDVINGGTLEGAASADLIANLYGTGSLTINSVIADNTSATALTKAGPGTLLLGGANTFTGGIFLNAGTIEMTGAGSLNGNAVNFDNGSSGVLDLNGVSASTGLVTTTAILAGTVPIIQNANATSSTLTINTAGTGSYAGTIQNGTGVGTLGVTLTGGGTQTLAGSNTYTGPTTVTNGDLIFTTSIPASSTFNVAGGSTLNTSAAGTLTLGTGKTLATSAPTSSTATETGAVTLSGGTITTGAATSTLQITTLTLGTGSINFSITDPTLTTGASGLINVSTSGGLTINGGTIYLSGGSFTHGNVYNITYDLFQYAGSILGTGPSALSIAPASEVNGLTYTIATSGGFVTLNVAGNPLFLANWTDDASTGSWATPGNWDAGVPNGKFDTAKLGGAASTHVNLARTVTLDGNETVGVLSFAAPNGESYTISQGSGGALTIDNGTGAGTIAVSGTHTIDSTVAVNLNSNTGIGTTLSSDKLTIAGVISNGSGLGANSLSYATLSTSGPGTVILANANTYGPSAGTVGTTLGGGTVQFQNAGAFGSGNIALGATSTLQAGAAGMSLVNNLIIGNAFTATIDTNGYTLTLPGVISDTNSNGNVVVASTIGGGTLILTNAETYGGTTTINSGATVNVGNGGTTGSLPSTAIVDNGALQNTRSNTGTVTIANAISGSGSLALNGASGTIYLLSGASSFSGGTTLTTGEVQLGNNAGLGTGDLTAGANTLDLNGFSPTFGALNGSGLVTSSAAGTLTITIGDNNHGSTFSGVIQNGSATSVSLVAEGTGTATLSGANTYTGTTQVNGGGTFTLTSTGGIGSSGTPSGAFTDNESTVNLTGGSVYASSFTANDTGGNGYVFLTAGATLNTGSGALNVNGSNGSNGGLLSIVGSTVTANSVFIGRDGVNDGTTFQTLGSTADGLYMNGGTLTIATTLGIGNNTNTTSTAQMRLDSGTVTVGGVTTITDNNNRLSLLNINGGSFTDNDTSGTGILVGGVYGDPYAELLVTGGVLTTPEITLGNSAQSSGTDEFYAIGGTTYIGNVAGTGGIVAGGATGTTTTPIALGLATATTAPTIGAVGNWSSSLGMTLINSTSAGAVTFQAADSGGTAHNISLSGVLTGSGGLIKTGGGTLTLTAGNSYAGVTAINGGTLNINGEFALGGAVYGGMSFNGGTLQYATAFTGNGTGDITENSLLVAKAVTINSGGATIDTNGNAVTYADPLGGGGTGGLTVADTAGTGSLTLDAAATYTGATTINSGATLQLGDGTTGHDGTITSSSGITDNGTLIYDRNGALSSSLVISGGGSVQVSGPGSQTLLGTNTYTGSTTINSGATLQLGNGTGGNDGTIASTSGITDNGNLVYDRAGAGSSSRTISGGGTLTVEGAGSQTLTATSGYTGTTTVASGGTLIVKGALNGTSSVADNGNLEVDGAVNSAATVALVTGATLDGTGSVGTITTAGGTLAPGNSSVLPAAAGTLTAGGNVTLDSTATFSIRVGVQTGADSDRLTVGGAIALNDASLLVTASNFTLGDLYVIINGGATGSGGSGSGGASDVFGNLNTAGAIPTYTNNNGFVFDVLYGVTPTGGNTYATGGSDVALELVAIPEPGTWASLLGGLGMLVVWQRSRRRRA